MAGELAETVRARIRRRTERTFDQSASLEAIDCALRETSEAESLLARHVAWLQDVKRRRKQEMAAGTWPPSTSEGS